MDTPTTLYALSWASFFLSITSFFLLVATPILYGWYAPRHNIRLLPVAVLLPVTGACLGVACTYYWSPLILFIPTLLFAFIGFSHRPWVLFCLHTAACVMVVGLQHQTHKEIHCCLQNYLQEKPRTIHAVVTDIEPWSRLSNGFVATLAVSHIDYQPQTTTIRCYLYRTPRFTVGDTLCVYRTQLAVQRQNEPHLLAYSLRDGVIGCLFAPFLHHRVLAHNTPLCRLHQWRSACRSSLYNNLKKQLASPAFSFVSALFFGNKNRPDYPKIRRHFAAWGLSHYLARSGLHIALIIMMLTAVFCFFPLPSWLKYVLLLMLLVGYSLLSWSSISFVRAFALWALCAGATIRRVLPQPLYLLGLIALATLLRTPCFAVCLDFQLSFFLTGTLLCRALYRARWVQLASCAW